MRQRRRTVLGALLTLVVFAGTASAECAWVLWEHQVGVGLHGSFVGWTTLGAWPGASECRRESDARFKMWSSEVPFAAWLEQAERGIKQENMKGKPVVSLDSITTH